MKYPVIKYSQSNQGFLSLVLPFNVIDSISNVLVYGQDEDGYQRKPNKLHYNKIKKYAIEESKTFILPTSIILGVDKEFAESKMSRMGEVDYIDIEDGEKKFRIIDGQHRIYGLREASLLNDSLKQFNLNVIIVLSQKDRRSVELEIFTDINSKAKRINTDLAELAKHDYEIKEHRIKQGQVNKHIGIKTAYYLKSQSDNNVWQNSIKFDIHSDVTIGIIGVSLFTESISSIIDFYMKNNPMRNEEGKILDGQKLIDYCQTAANVIGKFVHDIWNDIIKIKWNDAFRADIIKNDEGILVNTFYSKDYYIQKGIGIKAINALIGDAVNQTGISAVSKKTIEDQIFKSKIKMEHWKNGGPFSGFNSEAGFSKIKKMILNEDIVASGIR